MNTTTRLSNLEKRIQNVLNKDEPIWICICGEEPCLCTEEHKVGNCEKYPSESCVECKSSSRFRFMTGKTSSPTPIVPKEELPGLLEQVNKGEISFPIPILDGLSTK
jgi:hypothetical protein